MKLTFLSLLSTFSFLFTILFALITFCDLHSTQFGLTFNQSFVSFIYFSLCSIVSFSEMTKNS